MSRLAIVTALVGIMASGCFLAEGDPYRIAGRQAADGGVEIFYESCGKDIRIHSVSLAYRRADPVWRVSDPSESSRQRRFVVGEVPEGFVEDIAYEEGSLSGHYLVIVDSSYLQGETTTFEAEDLRSADFFGANDEYFSEDELANGALCDTD